MKEENKYVADDKKEAKRSERNYTFSNPILGGSYCHACWSVHFSKIGTIMKLEYSPASFFYQIEEIG
jgi:hypothetical protein